MYVILMYNSLLLYRINPLKKPDKYTETTHSLYHKININ